MAARTSTSPAAEPAAARLPVDLGRLWWCVGIGWLALLGLHLWIARGVTGPIVLQDETGYLGNARWLAGLSPVPEMGEQPVYAWGYSLVIASLVALVDDPGTLYRAVQILNSALLASLLPLLWLVLRRVGGVDPTAAALAAGVGAVFPATLVHSSIAWAESLLPVLMALMVLATFATLTDRPVWQRLWLAPVATTAYASHPRMLPALALVAVALVAGAMTRRVPRPVAVFGVAASALGFLVVRLIDAALVDARWPDRIDDEGSVVRLLGRLVNPTNWPELVMGSIGQAWYLAAASLGLAVVGVIAGAKWVARGSAADDPRRLTVAFGGVVMLALFVTSVVSFVGTVERVDHLVYGRYNEAWVPLLVATGAAAALTGRGFERRTVLSAAALVTVALGVVLWVGRGPGEFTGEVVWNNTLGLRLVMEVVGQRWMVPAATVLAVAVLGCHWLVGRRPLVPLAATAAGLVAMGVVGVWPLADFARVRYDGWELPGQMARVLETTGVDRVGLDRERVGLVGSLGYPFWLPSTEFRFADRLDDPPDLLVSAVDNGELDDAGARLVTLDARNGQGVWVLSDTPTFDRLRDAGALLPPAFPARLDPAARLARIEFWAGRSAGFVDTSGEEVRTRTELQVRAGETTVIQLRVVHTGSGQAWPSDVEWPLPGVVRVGARWYDESGSLLHASDWAPLPGPMWPGDDGVVRLELRPVDGEGRALPRGTYEVGFDLLQAEVGWFGDEGDEPLRVAVELS